MRNHYMAVLHVQKVKEIKLEQRDEDFFYDNLRMDVLYTVEVPDSFRIQIGKPLWFDLKGSLFHTEYLNQKKENKYRGGLSKYKIWISYD